MKFLDLFAGIGGFRLGMEQAGHECVGYVEWDKYARKSYEAIHDTEGEWTAHDITTVTDNDLRLLRDRGIDVICGGFPCQAFSVAGKRGGFSDTRGTMFFEIARFAEQIKPRILLLENVKGLLSHDKGNTFGTILYTLDELGYDCEWQVLNSKNFGVPQNRERVFIVGHLRGGSRREVFPIGGENENTACNFIGMLDIKGKDQVRRVYGIDGISPTLTTMQGGGQEPKIVKLEYIGSVGENKWLEDGKNLSRNQRQGDRVYDANGIASSLSAQGVGNHGGFSGLYKTGEYRIRKLTPRECWRLQGFPDWAFDKAAAVNSDSQLYKQAGNSVTVNVIYEIARRL